MPARTISGTSFRRMLKVAAIFAVALLAVAAKPAAKPAATIPKERYLSPLEIASSRDGGQLYVVCQDSDEVRVVDVQSGKVIGIIPVGRMPRGIALSPDSRQLYITNAWSDTVSVIDTSVLKVVQALPTGSEPSGIVSDKDNTTLYVANRLSGDISVIDLKSGQETKRLLAGRGASYLAISPDGKWIYCTHIYPNAGGFRSQPNSEITVIDTTTQTVVERKPLHNVAGVFHVALSADE
jgi:YVTN family beta-propeller protein